MENELKDKLILVPKISEIRHMGGVLLKSTQVYTVKNKNKNLMHERQKFLHQNKHTRDVIFLGPSRYVFIYAFLVLTIYP